jgi:hypothetical protein
MDMHNESDDSSEDSTQKFNSLEWENYGFRIELFSSEKFINSVLEMNTDRLSKIVEVLTEKAGKTKKNVRFGKHCLIIKNMTKSLSVEELTKIAKQERDRLLQLIDEKQMTSGFQNRLQLDSEEGENSI